MEIFVSATEKPAEIFAYFVEMCNNTIQYNTIQYNMYIMY